MPITRVTVAGARGVNRDISAVQLPEGDVADFTWSDAGNMRFLDGYAEEFYGHGIVYETPVVVPYHIMPLSIGGESYWIYAGASAIYSVVLGSGEVWVPELVLGGEFDSNTYWSEGGTWSIAGGVASCTVNSSNLTNTETITFEIGETYDIVYEVGAVSAGDLRIRVDPDTTLTIRSSAGTYTEQVVATLASSDVFGVECFGLTGSVISISMKKVITNPMVHTDLSGTTYTALPNSWTSGLLGGIPIFNNGTDDPQQWDTNVANNFTDLSNWPASTTCKAMRVYKQFLIAMDVTVSGTRYPYMVKWSHPAVPGSVPSSWDHTDETVDAGQTDLAEGAGYIIDGLQLRDAFIIYREGAIWVMQYTGGAFVFSFKKMLGTSGIMNRNCMVEFDGYHFVLTDSDMLVHDGNTALPVLDKLVRREVFKGMDSSAKDVAFVLKNPFFSEIWVCYPSVGKTSCDKAVVWNYRDKTIAFKEIPNVYHGVYGKIDEGITDSWDDDATPWSLDTSQWNEASNVPGQTRVLMASADTELYLIDAGGEGAPTESYLERTGLTFGAAERRTLIKGIRPRISGSGGEVIKISIGGTDDDPYATPTYDAVVDYVIGSEVRADMLVDRRYLAIKVEKAAATGNWKLDSFDIEWEDGGLW